NRMTPNTFEAIVLQGRTKLGTSSSNTAVTTDSMNLSKDAKEVAVPAPTPAEDVPFIKYGLGYFYAIKERNDSEFVSMAQDAGADVQHGEGAFLLRAGYDFPWVDGLSAYALAVFGTDPDLANQYRQNEFDFNLQWGPKKGALEGLSLRLRYAVVQQFGGNVDNLTDFRAIFNYVIKF